jgi:hypothetical protein
MSMAMQEVLEEARQLSPSEQLDLIRALSESLQEQYRENESLASTADRELLPSSIRRTRPATNFDEYVADFWPDSESVDDFNAYVKEQRTEDRLKD